MNATHNQGVMQASPVMTREEREVLAGFRNAGMERRDGMLSMARRATIKANKERKSMPQLRLVSSR